MTAWVDTCWASESPAWVQDLATCLTPGGHWVEICWASELPVWIQDLAACTIPPVTIVRRRREAGRRQQRERKRYVIDGKIIWATESELPQILATLLQRAESKPETLVVARHAEPLPPPATALPLEPDYAWLARYQRIMAEFQRIEDQDRRQAALHALQLAERMVVSWIAEDEADIEFIVLHMLH